MTTYKFSLKIWLFWSKIPHFRATLCWLASQFIIFYKNDNYWIFKEIIKPCTKSDLFGPAEIATLFGNIQKLKEYHENFSLELTQADHVDDLTKVRFQIFGQFSVNVSLYPIFFQLDRISLNDKKWAVISLHISCKVDFLKFILKWNAL